MNTSYKLSLGGGLSRGKIAPIWIVAVSVLIAFGLLLYPLQSPFAYFRPEFVVIVVGYWVIFQPARMGVWTAFWIGLGLDVFLNSGMGQHAFSLAIMVYVMDILSQSKIARHFGVSWLVMLLGATVYLLCMGLTDFVFKASPPDKVWIQCLFTIISYPIIYILLYPWKDSH